MASVVLVLTRSLTPGIQHVSFNTNHLSTNVDRFARCLQFVAA